MRRPSPAMIVALLGLFVALGGVGIAANGQSLILGSTNNSATAKTALAALINDQTLELTNINTGTGATALGLNVASGHTPFTVNSQKKVANLNADQLDGRDSSYFLPKTGKAADADKLDGIDSTGFVQGTGTVLSGATDVNPNTSANFIDRIYNHPSFTVNYICPRDTTTNGTVVFGNKDTQQSADLFADNGSPDPVYALLGPYLGSAPSYYATFASTTGEMLTFQARWYDGSMVTVWVMSVHQSNSLFRTTWCHVQAHALITK